MALDDPRSFSYLTTLTAPATATSALPAMYDERRSAPILEWSQGWELSVESVVADAPANIPLWSPPDDATATGLLSSSTWTLRLYQSATRVRPATAVNITTVTAPWIPQTLAADVVPYTPVGADSYAYFAILTNKAFAAAMATFRAAYAEMTPIATPLMVYDACAGRFGIVLDPQAVGQYLVGTNYYWIMLSPSAGTHEVVPFPRMAPDATYPTARFLNWEGQETGTSSYNAQANVATGALPPDTIWSKSQLVLWQEYRSTGTWGWANRFTLETSGMPVRSELLGVQFATAQSAVSTTAAVLHDSLMRSNDDIQTSGVDLAAGRWIPLNGSAVYGASWALYLHGYDGKKIPWMLLPGYSVTVRLAFRRLGDGGGDSRKRFAP